MLSSEWAAVVQQLVGLVLAFLPAWFSQYWNHGNQMVRRIGRVVAVLGFVLWLGVVYLIFGQEAEKRRESVWVKTRAAYLASEIGNFLGDAKEIRERMLSNKESETIAQDEKLRRARWIHTPEVRKWRDSVNAFYADELPGSFAGSGYDFGFGEGTTEWNMATLNGLVTEVTNVRNSLEILVARSAVPRTHKPDTRYAASTRRPLTP